MMIATTAFCFVAQKLLKEEHVELLDYASTVGQILHVLNMSKTELLVILQLSKANKDLIKSFLVCKFSNCRATNEVKSQTITISLKWKKAN